MSGSPHVGGSLAQAYQAADALLSLSYQENFGYAATEAVAHALAAGFSKGTGRRVTLGVSGQR